MSTAKAIFSPLDFLAQQMDRARTALLSRTLRVGFLLAAYNSLSVRLALGFFLLSTIYLPLALRRPDLLLAFGPLILGYPHLIASFRFISGERKPGSERLRFLPIFALSTLLYFSLRALLLHFKLFPSLPFGSLEIAVSGLTLLFSHGRVDIGLKIGVAAFLNCTLLWLAWQEPLIFAGGALILHNWVAFFFWLSVAKARAKLTAALATLFFLFVHCAVGLGWLDGFFPAIDVESSLFGEISTTGWILASWTKDPIIWYRAVVLYAFGLSLHYFVWLKAIPECRGELKRPLNFRASLRELQRDMGRKTLLLTAAISIVGFTVWCLSFPLGTKIYFGLALLHGWLELSFLVYQVGERLITSASSRCFD